MNKIRATVLYDRLELAANAIVSSLYAFAFFMIYKDGAWVFENSVFSTIVFLTSTSLYIGATLGLMELADYRDSLSG